MSDFALQNIRYNAGRGAFEARVDIRRGGQVFRYPCELAGPLSMEIDLVQTKLIEQARGMSDSNSAVRATC